MKISTPTNPIEVYTDGSHIKGTDQLGYGVWLEHDGRPYSLSGICTPTSLQQEFGITEPEVSNPTMEMVALVKALDQFKTSGEHLVLYADYQGVQKWVSGEWKAKKPYIQTLTRHARNLIRQIEAGGGSIRLKWVRGHSGVNGNEQADAAATDRAVYNTIPELFGNPSSKSYSPSSQSNLDTTSLQSELEALLAQPSDTVDPQEARALFERFVAALDRGLIRSAMRDEGGQWHVNAWVKQGILLGFRLGSIIEYASEPFPFFDKDTYPAKILNSDSRVRLVPGGSSIRTGAFVAPGVVCMPPMYINVGAYVDEGSMVDSHALVGSCAQIGKRVHLSAAAQVGGVIEPIGALPVIIEDDVFVGGNCGIYEGCLVRKGAVLASGVILTGSSRVYDVPNERILTREPGGPLEIPENAVVVPGSRPVDTSFGRTHGLALQTPIIVKYRDARTDAATTLEEVLR